MPKSHPASFRDSEESHAVKAAYLYIIEFQGELFHLSNYDSDIDVTGIPAAKGTDPQTFAAAQIANTSTEQSSDISANAMDITIGINESQFSQQLRQMILFTSPDRILVTVVRVSSAALPGPIVWGEDTFVEFKGVATNLTFSSGQVTVGLISLLLQGDGKVPRIYWQKTCQHDLYGTPCGADPDSVKNRLLTTVSSLDLRQRMIQIDNLTIDADLILARTFQFGKLLEHEGSHAGAVLSRISIMSTEVLPASAGVRLYLMWWSPTLQAGSFIRVLRGCRRILTDCEFFHPGVERSGLPFAGHPWIPDVSPAVHGLKGQPNSAKDQE